MLFPGTIFFPNTPYSTFTLIDTCAKGTWAIREKVKENPYPLIYSCYLL